MPSIGTEEWLIIVPSIGTPRDCTIMNKIKYPRTMNCPWSHSNSSDDVWWSDCEPFVGQEVVVTEKLDGECTTIYPDGQVHARSLETSHHPSRSWVKQFAAKFAHEIPQGWRICGENLYAWHSIFYTDLPSYFFVYGIYDDRNMCVSWDQVQELCELLDLQTVPVIYRGKWDANHIQKLWTGQGRFPTFGTKVEYPTPMEDFTPCEAEGYVIRLASEFPYQDFRTCCAKMVRENHVQTATNWLSRSVLPNVLYSQQSEP